MSETPFPVPDFSLFFICRFCLKMERQWGVSRVCQFKECGGPKRGRSFPLYEGPLTESYLRSHCVVCGSLAELQLQLEKEVRSLGICRKHLVAAGVTDKIPAQGTQDIGIITKVEQTTTTLYDLLGIDPVKDLGFSTPENEDGSLEKK